MAQLTARNIDILKIIVEEFIETGELLWSKSLLKKYNLWVSSATVRSDMVKLETLELIYQPYNSAWRLPTSKWLRAFVSYLMQNTPEHFLHETNSNIWQTNIDNLNDFTYKISYELAKNTKEISFFIFPEEKICEYSWISHFIEKNSSRLWEWIYSIIKMIEDKINFTSFIKSLPISEWVNTFIWEENILPYLKDYTIILKPISINWKIWYIWIIWSLKMNYSFNISAVRGII